MFTKTSLSKTADGAILPYRLLVAGGSAGTLAHGADATKPIIGVSTEVGSDDGCVVDAFIDQIPNVEYGGTVAYGDKLTSDATGRAITTTTTGNNIIGVAMVAGVVGDIGEVLIDRAIA